MNSVLPYWMQILQALLTPVIAFLAVVIAVFQWRTANEKVVIDLFDRHMKIYSDCLAVLRKVTTSPNQNNNENAYDFRRARADAEFLFGDEVVTHFTKVENAILDLATFNAELTPDLHDENERKELVRKIRAAKQTIESFCNEEFRSRLRPYMALKQNLKWWRPQSF